MEETSGFENIFERKWMLNWLYRILILSTILFFSFAGIAEKGF